MRDLFIVGAGGFGREAIWTVERINALSQQPQWNIIGYADDDPKWKKGDNFEGFPILGTIEEASRDYPGASVFIAVGIVFCLVGLLVRAVGTKWIDIIFSIQLLHLHRHTLL